VKLLGKAEMRRQAKIFCKLCEFDVKPPPISHPHEYFLFLVKEESSIELSNDFLVLVVPKGQKISDAMELTSFHDPVEMHILLVPHIVNVNPLIFHHGRWLPVEHGVVPILMKEGPKSLIRAPLLAVVVAWHVPESDNVPWILFIVVDLFPVGVDFRGADLQALKLVGGAGSATTRRRVLRGGLLSKTAGSRALGNLLVLGRGNLGGRATDFLTVLGATLLITSHSLQEKEETSKRKW
jgi:hypothetical protein